MPMSQPKSWPCCPEASVYFNHRFESYAQSNPTLASMRHRFLMQGGVALETLIDHWVLPDTQTLLDELSEIGLQELCTPEGDRYWKHPTARLPMVLVDYPLQKPTMAIGVESIELFLLKNELDASLVEGTLESNYRSATVSLEQNNLIVMSRLGYAGFQTQPISPDQVGLLELLRSQLALRGRNGDESETCKRISKIVKTASTDLGQARVAEEFFASEREYYLTRNAAARFQYSRQQQLGIGWANHDHHTYRSSRQGFRGLINLWLTMGFEIREKFYAGAEAGWGAQVLEHPVSRVVLFTDVDMSPDELDTDFAEETLSPRDELGTIGLWCSLHGSSIGAAGMHHIECEFDFTTAESLHQAQGGVMSPFTDLPMLKQAFTQPEMWQVPEDRLLPLVQRGIITPAQAHQFHDKGAPGSHLEILQRWEGFKGFNQTGISHIIRETDARR